MSPALALTLSLLAAAPAPSAAEQRGLSAITASGLRAHTRFLADDLLEGRGPGTTGDAITQRYLAAQFEALGLEPLGTDGFLQPFDLVGVDGNAKSMSVKNARGKSLTLRHLTDMVAVAGGPFTDVSISNAELVFVGYGIQAPEYQWDDFKDLDVKGKILVVMNSDPENDPALFGGKRRLWYGRWDYKYLQAAKLGAAGALIIHTTPSASYPWQVVQTGWTGEQFDLPDSTEPTMKLEGFVTEDAARRLFRLAGQDLDALRAAAEFREFKPVPLGLKASARIRSKVTRKRTANVLARLPGSDPKLAPEAVIFTAHHDHLGRKPDAKPGEDAIYNGALDNALGTASMLEVAHAMSQLPTAPRRSVIFAAVAAEEQGLLGSRYLAEHLPVPSHRLVANVNLDSGSIWGPAQDVSVVGFGKSSLDDVLTAAAATQGRRVTPDQNPESGGFYRSDQFNFARLGVPATYFSGGNEIRGKPAGWGAAQKRAWREAHYHQPSDELTSEWNLEGAILDAQLAFLVGYRVAEAQEPPAWRAGDEFEAVRKKDLEEARKTRR